MIEALTIQASNTVLQRADVEPQQAVKQYYSHAIQGFSAKLSPDKLEELRNDPDVKYVEKDYKISLSPIDDTDSSFPGQPSPETGNQRAKAQAQADFVPYGITRVGGTEDGTGKFAWVIDTGIDLDHSDLNVNTQYSESFVGSEPSPNDLNGHGTHVAGTIGAKSNGFGVVGVAPNTELFAVKVLDRNGGGSYSDIIAGVDYVAQYAFAGEVANLSLGGPVSQALDDAIRNCADQGVLVTLAAGNSSANANNSSPARVEYNNVWTISAIDSNDNFASFSNFANPPIEFAAPGVDVWSTWIGDNYNQISGTSMASPHVGGILTVGGINPDGVANGDPDGNADPIATRD